MSETVAYPRLRVHDGREYLCCRGEGVMDRGWTGRSGLHDDVVQMLGQMKVGRLEEEQRTMDDFFKNILAEG